MKPSDTTAGWPHPTANDHDPSTDPTSRAEGPPARARWVASRRPVILAALAVVAVCALGWALRWWGPLNPDVTAMTIGIGSDATTLVDLHNGSVAAVDITATEVIADPRNTVTNGVLPTVAATSLAPVPPSAVPGQLPTTAVEPVGPVGPPRGKPLPAALAGRSEAALSATLAYEGCRPGLSLQPYRLRVHYRTAAGRELTQDTVDTMSGSCPDRLPSGPPPADPTAASAAITEAYRVVYSPASDAAARTALVDDAHGLAEITTAAATGPRGAEMVDLTATVTEVSFDQPDHAWVRYTLTGPGIAPYSSTGQARLVDGTWKVQRATVCHDLGLLAVSCP